MTLEQFAYLSEIVGPILVIGTLIYLAQQVRQSTHMLRSAAASEFLQHDMDLGKTMLESRDIAEIWVKSEDDFNLLDDVDRARMLLFERRALEVWYHEFKMHEQGFFPEYKWQQLQWFVQNFGRRQSLREAWQAFQASYDASFREFIENHFRAADAADS